MSKKLTHVNGFKAPEEWYARVAKIAEERQTTIGNAIQYVFNLGLPVYERVRAMEQQTIAQAMRDLGQPPGEAPSPQRESMSNTPDMPLQKKKTGGEQ